MNPEWKILGRSLSRLLIAAALATVLPARAENSNEIEELKAKIAELDQQLRILIRKQDIASEEAAEKKKSTPVLIASDKGFGLQSSDGQFEYKLRGVMQLDYRDYGGSAFPQAVDGFVLSRARPTFEGTLFGKYGFRFTPEFGDGKSGVVDAYLDLKFDPAFQVRLGKFKPFVGLERLYNDVDTKFIERGYVSNNILPNRDVGVSLYGDLFGKKLNYAVGLFNGVTDGGDATTAQDLNSQKEVTGRLFATPFVGTDSLLQGLGFGIAVTSGDSNLNSPASGSAIGVPVYKTPGQSNNFFTYASRVASNGKRERWSPQAYFYRGPFGLIAEYAQVSQDLINSASTRTTAKNTAWQLAASWLLTGEDASFRGVKPYSPFRQGADGGWGAFELVARYQENRIDDNLPSSFRGANYALRAKSAAVGLNWYLNDNSKFAMNYEHTTMEDGTLSGKTEDYLVARYQLAF